MHSMIACDIFFSKVFHARHISIHMSLNGAKHMYSDNQLDCICFMRCHIFKVHVYQYFPKVRNDMYACEAEL
jgi:hypothetical protein